MAKKDTGIVNIHGREYKTVALRVAEFRESFPIQDGWGIETQVYHVDDESVIVRAIITDPEGRIAGTGHGEERRASSNINKTSALENAETSAIGRALAAVGLAGTEYASADEVANAISQQSAAPSKPSQKQRDFYWKLIKQQPQEAQAAMIEEARTMNAQQMSAAIDKLRGGA